MGLYGRVSQSQTTQKNKNIYTSLKGYEKGLEAMLSKMIQDVFHLLAGTNWISLQATWYHDISWWIRWYILIYLDIFQKHSLKIDIWYTLAIDIHWVEIDLHKLSWLCVFKRYRINSIHIKPNAAWCPIFDPFFALLCTDMPRYAKINLYVHRTWLYARVLWLRASTLGVSCQPTQLCWPRGG